MGDSPEESSWTFYIEGFICDDKDDTFCSYQPESPSLVSDAASSAVNKLGDWRETLGFSNQNSFKKQKTKVAILDYDLEDTASSPVNSPKVSYINHFMKEKEKAKMDVSEVKRNSFGAFSVEKDTNNTDLEKKTIY